MDGVESLKKVTEH